MVWTALGFLVLALGLGAFAIHVGGNARAPDIVAWAVVIAIGSVTSLVAAMVLGVLAALG